MKLTLDTIKSVTVGAIKIESLSDGIHFYKCTPKQTAAMTALAEDIGHRSLTTTGIRLDFHTDSRYLRFGTALGNRFEVLRDGLLVRQFAFNDGESSLLCHTDLSPYAESPRQMRRVSLYLPCHSIGILTYVELEDGARIEPHRFKRKMLFLGDSITQGWISDYDTSSFAIRTSNFFDADSIIQGVGSTFFHQSTFDTLPYDPDVVIVAFGTNDAFYYSTFEEMEYQAAAYMDSIKDAYDNRKVLVLSPIWRGTADGESMGESFSAHRKMIECQAQRHGFHTVSGLELMPAHPYFYADTYLHPNDIGFSVYTERLCKFILDNVISSPKAIATIK